MADGFLKDIDAAERAQLMRVVVYFGPPCFLMLSLLWYFLVAKGVIPGWLFVVLLVLNIPLTAAGVFLIHGGTSLASQGLVKTIFAAGDIPPPPTYPRQETLIVRGHYAEAAEYYRDHLTINPDDNEARLRLADLYEKQLDEAASAEALYLQVRRLQPTPRHEAMAANGLIDLYRKTGQRGRLMVELARFAERYRGSPAAAEATRLLNELKEEDRANEG